MRIGRYSVVVASATATKIMSKEEWNMVADRVKPIDISPITTDAQAGMIVHEKIKKIYKVINRENIPVSDKRKLLMYLCHES